MRMLAIASVVAVSASAVVAFGGKLERDLMTKEVAPQLKDTQDKWQKSCGCALSITVDEASIKTTDDLRSAKNIARHIADGVGKYCSDDASKKALCQMKSLTIAKAKPAGFTFKDGNGTATTDGQMGCSFEQITHVLDK